MALEPVDVLTALGGAGSGVGVSLAEEKIRRDVFHQPPGNKILVWTAVVPFSFASGAFYHLAHSRWSARRNEWELAAIFTGGFAVGVLLTDLYGFLSLRGTPWEGNELIPKNSVLYKNAPPGAEGDALYAWFGQQLAQSAYQGAVDPVIRQKAIDIIAQGNLDGRDTAGVMLGLQQWVQNNIRYVKDPWRTEVFQSPRKTLDVKAGDCDDMNPLLASMAMSVGIPVNLKLYGFEAGKAEYGHIIATVPNGDGTDTTYETIVKDTPPGWEPPNVHRTMMVNMVDPFHVVTSVKEV